MEFAGITFANTVAPLLGLGVLACALPFLLVKRDTRLHLDVVLGMLRAALILILVSFGLMVAVDQREFSAGLVLGSDQAVALIYWWIFLNSLMLAVVWGPVLCLVWLGMAQRVEKLRGEDMLRGDSQ